MYLIAATEIFGWPRILISAVGYEINVYEAQPARKCEIHLVQSKLHMDLIAKGMVVQKVHELSSPIVLLENVEKSQGHTSRCCDVPTTSESFRSRLIRSR